jgi:hypothetical protein
MQDKGYDHPLHSLDLVPLAQAGEDEPRYAIFIPQGRLVVRPELRRRAAGITTAVCEEAVAVALARHRGAAEGFARFGLDARWAENMAYWTDQMLAQQGKRERLEAEMDDARTVLQGLCLKGRERWARLWMVSRMAGLVGVVTSGRAPKGESPFCEALLAAAAQAQRPHLAEALAGHGFKTTEAAAIMDLVAEIRAARRRVQELAVLHGEAGDALLVMRGALIGDLGRLCQAAPMVQGTHRAALQMSNLLGERRKKAEAA